MNIITLSGYVNNPRLREFTNAKGEQGEIISFSLGVYNAGQKDPETGKKTTGYIDVTVFSPAQWVRDGIMSSETNKGVQAMVSGEIEQQHWQDKDNPEKRNYKMAVIARSVEVFSRLSTEETTDIPATDMPAPSSSELDDLFGADTTKVTLK